jgi:hypothetical protein
MNTIYRFEFVLQMVRTKGLQSLHPRPSKTLVSLPLLPAAAAAPPPRDTIGAATSAAVGSTPIMAPISNPNPLALGPRAEMGRRHVSRWRSRGRKKTSRKSLEVDRFRIPCGPDQQTFDSAVKNLTRLFCRAVHMKRVVQKQSQPVQELLAAQNISWCLVSKHCAKTHW